MHGHNILHVSESLVQSATIVLDLQDSFLFTQCTENIDKTLWIPPAVTHYQVKGWAAIIYDG